MRCCYRSLPTAHHLPANDASLAMPTSHNKHREPETCEVAHLLNEPVSSYPISTLILPACVCSSPPTPSPLPCCQVTGVMDAMPSATLKPEDEEAELDSGRVYRVTYMFSATMPPTVERLARKYLRNPVVVRGGGGETLRRLQTVQEVTAQPRGGEGGKAGGQRGWVVIHHW